MAHPKLEGLFGSIVGLCEAMKGKPPGSVLSACPEMRVLTVPIRGRLFVIYRLDAGELVYAVAVTFNDVIYAGDKEQLRSDLALSMLFDHGVVGDDPDADSCDGGNEPGEPSEAFRSWCNTVLQHHLGGSRLSTAEWRDGQLHINWPKKSAPGLVVRDAFEGFQQLAALAWAPVDSGEFSRLLQKSASAMADIKTTSC